MIPLNKNREQKSSQDELTYTDIQDILMENLRLMHFPVAVKFVFSDKELEDFKENGGEFYQPVKKMTFCQWEIAARMKGQTVLAEKEHLGCPNAQYCFGWKPLDDKEIDSHLKYVKDRDQAERFVKSKSRLADDELKAIIVAPLSETYFTPDTVHFYCDNMQAYHLAVDYMAALDIHPLKTNITMNSSACSGNVYSYQENAANMLTACSGSYNAGKTERGEINFIIPGTQIEAVVRRLLERMETMGSGAITRPGDNFPGADVCKNCPLIIFKKAK